MELWLGKVAVVTGASSGIGAAICKDLCKEGVIVVGLARRLERLEKLKEEILEIKANAVFYPFKCDLTVESEIEAAFEHVVSTFGGVDILVNNAGMSFRGSVFDENSLDGMKKVIETNLVAVVSCTKKAFCSMSARDTPGYIINISSKLGHFVPSFKGKPNLNVYPSSKYGLKALNEVIRHELNYFQKNKIRVSNVSPGAVKSDMTAASSSTDSEDIKYVFKDIMEAEDVSNVVLYLLGTNPRVQIQDVIIRPTGDSF